MMTLFTSLKGDWNLGGKGQNILLGLSASAWTHSNRQCLMFAIGMESNKHYKFNYESVGIFDGKHLKNVIENIHCTMGITDYGHTQCVYRHTHRSIIGWLYIYKFGFISPFLFGILVVGVLFLAIRHSALTSPIIKLHMKVKSKYNNNNNNNNQTFCSCWSKK